MNYSLEILNRITGLSLFAVLILTLFSCEENYLEDDLVQEPVLFVSFNFDGTSYIFEGGAGTYWINPQRIISEKDEIASFSCSVDDTENTLLRHFAINIDNYMNTYDTSGDILAQTIKTGIYDFASTGKDIEVSLFYYESPFNLYTTLGIYQSGSKFFITSLKDTIYNDQSYKMAEIEFDCRMINQSSDTAYVTNGRGKVVF